MNRVDNAKLQANLPSIKRGDKVRVFWSEGGQDTAHFVKISGLGYRIGFDYHQYRIPAMYGLIIFVALLAILVNVVLDRLERRIRRDML